MSDDERVWSLVQSIEDELPLQRDTLEALFGVSFKGSVDQFRQPILVATTACYEVELRAPSGASQGSLGIRFTPPPVMPSSSMTTRFPGGHWVPPPPPGYGVPDAQGAYIVERPWGQLWFALYTGDRLFQVSFAPGKRGSPGV